MFAAALPGLVLGLVLLAQSDLALRTKWTLGGIAVLATLVFASAAREAVGRPLQTLSNLLGALREEDFSFRARVGRRDDPLGQALFEVNALAQTLREQRLGALEATALLRKVMEEIDVAVFAFEARSRCSSRTAPASGCWRARRGAAGRTAPRRSASPACWWARRRASSTRPSRAHRPLRPAARDLPAAGQAACSCSCSPT